MAVEEFGPRLAISEWVVADRAAAEGIALTEEAALTVDASPSGGTGCRGCPFRMGACTYSRSATVASAASATIDQVSSNVD